RQDLVGQRLTTLQGQVSQAQAARQQKQNLYDQVKNADPAEDAVDTFPAIGANAAVVDARSALRDAQAKVQTLTRQNFGDEYPPLKAAKQEVANAKDKLVAARRTVIESIKQDYQAAAINERQMTAALDGVK